MGAEPDVTRIVRSWLRAEEHESADRVLDTVLAQLDTTRQRRSWWPAWRFADMNTITKVGIGAAAIAVVAIVGINLLPGSGGVGGGPTVSPSPSPAVSPSPSAAASPVAEFPPIGPLAAGTHAAVVEGVPLTFSVPATGWSHVEGLGYSIEKGVYEQASGLSLIFWPNAPENVYSDPCAHTALSPAPSASAAGLAAAVAAIPGTELVSGPSSVDVGGRPAQHVAITIRDDLGCDPHDAYLWYDESSGGASGGWRWAPALGSTVQVWIVDVDDKLVWIDSETFKGAGPEPGQDIQKVIDSISFG